MKIAAIVLTLWLTGTILAANHRLPGMLNGPPWTSPAKIKVTKG